MTEAGGSVQLRNPDTGVVFGFTEPLPPAIRRQWDEGKLIPATEPATEPGGRPRGNASHQAWIDYAAGQGMDRAEAAALTRAELRERFTTPPFDPRTPPQGV